MRLPTIDQRRRSERRRHLLAGAAVPAIFLVAACSTGDGSTNSAVAIEASTSTSTSSSTSTSTSTSSSTSTSVPVEESGTNNDAGDGGGSSAAPISTRPSADRDTTSEAAQTPAAPAAVADGSGCSPGGDALGDGRWFGYVTSAEAGEIEFDLACLFSDENASLAQVEDGEDPLVIDDIYIRNSSQVSRTLSVAGDTPVDWHRDGRPESVEITYDEWAFEQNQLLGAWITISEGEVVAIDEKWSP